jgi:hypothetical protein
MIMGLFTKRIYKINHPINLYSLQQTDLTLLQP